MKSDLCRIVRPSSVTQPHQIEILESRIAPASVNVLSIGGTTTGSFTDADGDVITIHISGTAGQIDLAEVGGANGIVDDGEAIGAIAITGATSDFVVTVSVNSTGSSNGIVELGAVTSDKGIFAFNTVADTTGGQVTSSFDLTSYTGPGFTTGGGLFVDKILNGLDLGLIQDGVTVAARTSIGGDVILDKPLAGAIVAGSVSGGSWELPSIAATGSIVVTNDMSALVETGAIAGDVTIGGNATNPWTIGAVAATASLQAAQWSSVHAIGTFGGKLISTNGSLTFSVDGSLAPTANILSGGSATLEVTGSIPAKAAIQSSSTLNMTVGGSFAGHAHADSSLILLASSGTVSGVLSSSSSLTVEAKSISKLEAMHDGDSTFIVTGNVTNSQVFGGDSTLSFAVAGSISNTTVVADGVESATTGDGKNYGSDSQIVDYKGIKGLTNVQFETSESGISLEVIGNVSGSTFNGGSEDVSLTIGGNLSKSKFTAAESDVSLDVSGSVSGVQIAADGDISLSIGGTLTASDLNASDAIRIAAEKSISGIIGVAGDDISLESPLISKSQFSATEDFVVEAGSITSSFFKASDRNDNTSSFDVSGAVTKSSIVTRKSLVFKSGSLTGSTLSSQEDDVSATIEGALTASRILAQEEDVLLSVGGTANGLFLDAASFVSVSIQGDLLSSRIFADEDSDLILNVTKNVVNTFVNNGSSEIEATIGGDVIKSRFFAEESFVSVSVGGNVTGSIFAGSGASVSVGGNLTSSRIEGDDESVSLTIQGTLTKSSLAAMGGVRLDASKDALDVEITADGASVLEVDGNFKGTFANSSSSLLLNVGGSVLPTSKITNVGATTITTTNFDATLNAGTLDFLASGNVGALARIQTNAVGDLGDGDTNGFNVGGTFGGRLTVSGDFSGGDAATQTIVGGDVLKTARIIIGGDLTGASTQFVFGGAYAGTLSIGGNMTKDISFAGDVNSIVIGGSVLGDLVVTGKIARVVAGSVFTATDANDGTFANGAGTAIGSIDTTTGHGLVISTI